MNNHEGENRPRIHTSILVSEEENEAFLDAVSDFGGSKSRVIKEAIRFWLEENGYLSRRWY